MLTEVDKISIIILVSFRLSQEKFWLHQELEKLGFNVTTLDIPDYNFKNRIVKWREILLWFDYFKLALRGIKVAKQNESVVVSLHFLVGVFVTILSRILTNKKQPVIALTLLAHNKGILNQLLRQITYRLAFLSDKFLMTVNSSDLREQYIKSFGIPPQIISVLYDCWDSYYEILPPNNNDDKYIFSGGEAARDWDTLLAVAAACPEIQFKIVARKMYWNFSRKLTLNVEVFFDTSDEKFYSLALQSRLVLLPLVGKVTAGLIVLIRSVLLGKMVISTETPATKLYYPDDCRDLLVAESDVETIISRIKYYWEEHENRINKAIKLQAYMKEKFSPEVFTKQLSILINQLSSTNKKSQEYQICQH
ncbi:MAG: glycosyltransferase [Chlorogloeopsis fritschii C42_A2020_084]|uniref:glycosyltransferase family 1 protein n=1 Tax=Chlorogloeopsis fritschii TaxID=1124 RepID=UPI0019FC3E8F|nr:glycosyltransferase family 1 protein [Chlorogloeopsis fritschii]MBF2007220.1 glycosyltransferase [Chlorogloeopsis fritschii C42_A2020_084]